MIKELKKLFNILEKGDPKIIVTITHQIMIELNNGFSIKEQNEIISQVISNIIQIRELEIEKNTKRLKELNEGNLYLKKLVKDIS